VTSLWALHHRLQTFAATRRAWCDAAALACSPARRAALRAEATQASTDAARAYERLADDVLRLAPYWRGEVVVERAMEAAAQAGDVAAYDAADRILALARELKERVVE